jgi:hypothetical protein
MLRMGVMVSLLVGALAVAVARGQLDAQSASTQAAAVVGGQAAGASAHRFAGIMPIRGAKPNAAAGAAANVASNPLNIPYSSGPVLPNTTTYAFWWGTPSDFPSDAREGIHEFLESLDGSTYLDIADQYMLGQDARIHFGGDIFDYSAPPAQDPPTPPIIAEIYNVLSANGQKPDPTALYMVFTSNFPNENYYCAFHDYGIAPDGTAIHITYVPNYSSMLTACSTNMDPLYTPNKRSEATRSMADLAAHEFMESITDPTFEAWEGPPPNYDEIGDPCDFVFQSWVPLKDDRWKIQEIWSNGAGGCVQGAGRPAHVSGDISSAGIIKTFDFAAAADGTFSQSINVFGAAAGYYTDATHEFHAFARDSLGNIATIDPPGTGTGYYGGAQALSINNAGAITGNWADTNFVLHGFVRDSRGNYVSFDLPGAALTAPTSINNKGAIAGSFEDANSVNHGFVRDSQGNFATFDAPGAANGLLGGTTVQSISENGAVAGNYLDASNVNHGFVRHVDGSMVIIDVPGASQGTFAQSINVVGAIVGYCTDANFVSHGFVRDALGKIKTFDEPNAATGGTFALSINAFGAVAGYYSDASGFPHGFVRDRFGNFTTLSSSGEDYGNVIRSINDVGGTAGYDTKATF